MFVCVCLTVDRASVCDILISDSTTIQVDEQTKTEEKIKLNDGMEKVTLD